MVIIRIEDGGGRRYALVGETSFELSPIYPLTGADYTIVNRWAQTWGDSRKVDGAAWSAELARVNRARVSSGLNPLPVV